MVGKWRLTKPILGIRGELRDGVAVPAGTVVEILASPLDGSRTVNVLCNGERMVMFKQDLWDRSEPAE